MRTRKKVADVIENQVAKLLLENKKYTAKELRHKVEKAIYGKYRFTERTYSNIKKKMLQSLIDKPEDELWSLGACLKYHIPTDIIPLLMEWHDIEPFTVRIARWAAIIHPIATTKQTLQRMYPGNLLTAFVFHVARQYAERERIAEIMKRPFPDTLELDRLYFIINEPHLIDGFVSTFFPDAKKDAERAIDSICIERYSAINRSIT